MDGAYGSVMREEGISYRLIGIELARRERRKMPYRDVAVRYAVTKFNSILAEGERNDHME
jgi:hypothetical protein